MYVAMPAETSAIGHRSPYLYRRNLAETSRGWSCSSQNPLGPGSSARRTMIHSCFSTVSLLILLRLLRK